MAISPREFPARKGRRKAAASSSLRRSSSACSSAGLLHSLLHLSRDISSAKPPPDSCPLQLCNTRSLRRKAELLSLLFEELIPAPSARRHLPTSAKLCLQEILMVLQRMRSLIDEIYDKSRFWLLVRTESIANLFHEAEADLSTLLDILPVADLAVSEDVKDQVLLVKSQCRRQPEDYVDPADMELRSDVFAVIGDIEGEVIPSHGRLSDIFRRVKLNDSRACRSEIKNLESELEGQAIPDKSAATIAALVGLVRYATCVLFGASTPRPHRKSDDAEPPADIAVPPDFRCPISLDLMRDPVVVSTGQTYDRVSITRWIESGSVTCPKTGQPLVHTDLTPNWALKNLIAKWCRQMSIPFKSSETSCYGMSQGPLPLPVSKAAAEATRMTASFLIESLRDAGESASADAATRIVHELRNLAKVSNESRGYIADSGAVELLGPLLRSEYPNLQVNAVTALLNLSILEANKKRMMDANGILDGVIHVLQFGATWEAKENAAATIFSLTVVRAHRKVICKDPRVTEGLVEMVNMGSTTSKGDALVAILNLAGEREAVGLLVDSGVVQAALAAMPDAPEEAAMVIAALAKRGGILAIAAADGAVKSLLKLLLNGTDRSRESAAAALVLLCKKIGTAALELARTPGIEHAIWEIIGSGTPRAKAKAGALARICHILATAGHPATRFRFQSTLVQN